MKEEEEAGEGARPSSLGARESRLTLRGATTEKLAHPRTVRATHASIEACESVRGAGV